MKNKFFLGLLAAIGALFLFSFESEKQAFAPTTPYRYTWTADTITNAEIDTVSVPASFLSNYQFQIQAVRTSLSGTHNVKLYLDESNLTSGITDWRVIDSTSTTTATIGAIRQSVSYGLRYRVRVKGTGTQSSRYAMNIVAKPLN
jgi:hypothetical protein